LHNYLYITFNVIRQILTTKSVLKFIWSWLCM
jgi:hypothetical protein